MVQAKQVTIFRKPVHPYNVIELTYQDKMTGLPDWRVSHPFPIKKH